MYCHKLQFMPPAHKKKNCYFTVRQESFLAHKPLSRLSNKIKVLFKIQIDVFIGTLLQLRFKHFYVRVISFKMMYESFHFNKLLIKNKIIMI